MNREQWAFQQGYETAMRSLGIKDLDDTADPDVDKLDGQMDFRMGGMFNGGLIKEVMNGDVGDRMKDFPSAASTFFDAISSIRMTRAIPSWIRELQGYIDEYSKQGLTPENSKTMNLATSVVDGLTAAMPKYEELDQAFRDVKEAYNKYVETANNLKA